MSLRDRILRLRAAEQGSAVIEFAVAAPVLLLLLIGIYDMAHRAYLTAILHGAVEEAARQDGLESADNAKADAYVEAMVKRVAPGADVKFKRLSYYDFADLKRAETWNDKNANGRCDNGEAYTDENRNGKWDADIGTENESGGNDVVLYTATVTYTPVFIVPFMPNSTSQRTLTASTVHKNQPYELQAKYGSDAGTCS
ncbi:TadE/TadG family type IV pilus assembly protein [Novosphingobium guangzhouense]|uniref:Pilus assembly protein TadE n=1 Tax=Novosphingobium guangzhouense TaxID=1850347 RepID=A0A2K2G3Z7_9SPHN|nr:TadE family protein [Novosphingobium guangzhouense]PNU05763.1 pilus assembly protein TadE [Novosphingobium guangzhouense]